MTKLASEICGIQVASPLLNAAGAKDVSADDLAALAQSDVGAVVIKTATVDFRRGNPTPRWHSNQSGSLNSMGLPNLGYQRYVELLPQLRESGKPVIASVSGMAPGDNETMLAAYSAAGADLLEVNLSCPNLVGKGQLGYDFVASREMLTACRAVTDRPLGVKLPPYLDGFQYEQMAEVLTATKIDFIVTINSIGNALMIDPATERTVIAPNDGFGGLGGGYVKPVALANVHKWYQLLGDRLPIIGVGGVQTGTDAFEHLLAGASLVGVGTALVNEGPAVFSRLQAELSSMLDEHGYSTPEAARGKLQELPADA